MATAYRIKDWQKHFEVSQAKKVQRWAWVPTPTEHTVRFRRLMRINPAFYAVFKVMLDLAANCQVRGLLVRDGAPLDTEYMAEDSNIPEEIFRAGVQALTSGPIGWIECVSVDDAGRVLGDISQHAPSTLPDRSSEVAPTEPNRTEPEISEAYRTEAEPTDAREAEEPGPDAEDGSGGCAEDRPSATAVGSETAMDPARAAQRLGTMVGNLLAGIWPMEFAGSTQGGAANRRTFSRHVGRICARDGPQAARLAVDRIVTLARQKAGAAKIGELTRPIAALNAEVMQEFCLQRREMAGGRRR